MLGKTWKNDQICSLHGCIIFISKIQMATSWVLIHHAGWFWGNKASKQLCWCHIYVTYQLGSGILSRDLPVPRFLWHQPAAIRSQLRWRRCRPQLFSGAEMDKTTRPPNEDKEEKTWVCHKIQKTTIRANSWHSPSSGPCQRYFSQNSAPLGIKMLDQPGDTVNKLPR